MLELPALWPCSGTKLHTEISGIVFLSSAWLRMPVASTVLSLKRKVAFYRVPEQHRADCESSHDQGDIVVVTREKNGRRQKFLFQMKMSTIVVIVLVVRDDLLSLLISDKGGDQSGRERPSRDQRGCVVAKARAVNDPTCSHHTATASSAWGGHDATRDGTATSSSLRTHMRLETPTHLTNGVASECQFGLEPTSHTSTHVSVDMRHPLVSFGRLATCLQAPVCTTSLHRAALCCRGGGGSSVLPTVWHSASHMSKDMSQDTPTQGRAAQGPRARHALLRERMAPVCPGCLRALPSPPPPACSLSSRCLQVGGCASHGRGHVWHARRVGAGRWPSEGLPRGLAPGLPSPPRPPECASVSEAGRERRPPASLLPASALPAPSLPSPSSEPPTGLPAPPPCRPTGTWAATFAPDVGPVSQSCPACT